MQPLNHTRNEAIYNMSMHQLPQYYQPQQVSSMALVMRYKHHKLAPTEMLYVSYVKVEVVSLNWIESKPKTFMTRACAKLKKKNKREKRNLLFHEKIK